TPGNAAIDPTAVMLADMPTQGTADVDPATGMVTYTPDAGFEGDDTFTYTMKDEDGYTSNVATVTVTVGGNNGGLMANDDSAVTPLDTPVDIDILANDVAGNAAIDPATVTIMSQPGNGMAEVDPVSGVATYTPDTGFEGEDSFTYTVKDDDGYTTNEATVTITVGGNNGGLMANDDEASTPVDIPVTIPVLDNDVAGNAPIDPATVTIGTAPANGTPVVNPDGTVEYTPNTGYEGEDSFTYTVKDDEGYISNEATVTITIGGDNGGLMANDDSAVTPLDTPVDIDILANDVAGNAAIDPATVTIMSQPGDGMAEVDPVSGVATYTPDTGFTGEDTFTYTVKDDDGYTTNEATVTITVGGNNGGLMANDDSAVTPLDTPVDIDILANDVAGNAAIDPATVTIMSQAGDGMAEVDPVSGVATYTPDAGFTGEDTFTYTVKDDDGYTTNEATVTITVGGNNGGLMANDDSAVTPLDTPVDIDILANDEAGNVPIDPTTVTIMSQAGDGMAEVDPVSGVATYTPDAGFTGEDTFTYTVKDDDGYTTNEATVTIIVGGNNGGLMANDDSVTTLVDTPVDIDVVANDQAGNADIDPVTVALVDLPENGTANVYDNTGVVEYVPNAGFIGEDTFTYTVDDEDGYTSNVATVTITIDPEPTGPIANDDAAHVNPNSFVTIAVLDNDAEGSAPIDPATVEEVTGPENGGIAINDDGTVDYIPDAGFIGEDSFQYTVKDEEGRVSNVATVTVDVTTDSDLAISITVDELQPAIDSNVEFTITVTNDGDQVFSNIIVDEALPSGYEFVRGESPDGDYDDLTEKWTIGHIDAEGTATLTIIAKVVAVAGADYLNVVTIAESSPADVNPDNNTAQIAVEPLLLVVYNEFSPNGDGFNDTFVIDGIQLYPNNTIQVYNRYGNLVFKTSGYNNDWEGIANKSGAIKKNDKLPVGTYFYVMDTGTGIRKSGWLYIAR
ncbi:tandem-95 repeat protein, partial [Sinomicrobium sp. 2019215]